MIKKIETGLFVFIIILVIGVAVLAGININKNSQENKADRDSLAVETNIAKETAKKEGFTSSEQKSTDIISESDAGQEVQTESKKDYSIMCMEAYKQASYKNNIVLLTIGKYALYRCRYYKSLIRNRVAFFACIYVLGCLFSAIYRKRFVATS